MANKHSTLTGLFGDIADAIREKTGAPSLELLFPEQSVENDDLISNIEVSLRDHFPVAGETYIVTVDGVPYRCKAYNSEYGDICIGDSRLAVNDESNPEDVPFGIDTYMTSDDSGWNMWQEWFVTFTYAGTHTLKIEREPEDFKTIVADNFPDEIAAIDTQEDLDPELATQDAKIAELQDILGNKASATVSVFDDGNGNVTITSMDLTLSVD